MYAEATKMLQGEIDQNIKYVNGLFTENSMEQAFRNSSILIEIAQAELTEFSENVN